MSCQNHGLEFLLRSKYDYEGGGTYFWEHGFMGWVGAHLEKVVVFYAGEKGENVFFELGTDIIFAA